MSELRKELVSRRGPSSFTYESAYFRVLQAVLVKRSLIHGRLHRGKRSCAIGCAFDDGVEDLPSRVIDEIAAYNDSFPKLSDAERWKRVSKWLKFRVKAMEKSP